MRISTRYVPEVGDTLHMLNARGMQRAANGETPDPTHDVEEVLVAQQIVRQLFFDDADSGPETWLVVVNDERLGRWLRVVAVDKQRYFAIDTDNVNDQCYGPCYAEFGKGRACSRHGRLPGGFR